MIKRYRAVEKTIEKIRPVKKNVLFKSVPTKGTHTIVDRIGENIKKVPATLRNQLIILNKLVYPDI
jgi:hypothetical protein